MLSVSFTCLKSRQNKAGQSPIQLWVNVDGKRATTILSLRAAPQEFQKAMKSKQNNPILLYCNNVIGSIKYDGLYFPIYFAEDGVTAVEISGKWGVVNKQGEEVRTMIYDNSKEAFESIGVKIKGVWL